MFKHACLHTWVEGENDALLLILKTKYIVCFKTLIFLFDYLIVCIIKYDSSTVCTLCILLAIPRQVQCTVLYDVPPL